jgi:hypothetical protein
VTLYQPESSSGSGSGGHSGSQHGSISIGTVDTALSVTVPLPGPVPTVYDTDTLTELLGPTSTVETPGEHALTSPVFEHVRMYDSQ